ncbi:MAG TPA: alpha/beta fold hydrolase [Gaiellaceae bacterium]
MKIAWQSHGSGAPVLLIQGLGYGGWGWDPVVPGLAERFRVLTFDNRGIGGSDKPAGPYTTAELAADALQVLDEAGVDRAHVVGASLGGMIAQELATLRAERVEKLVLCCTTPGGTDGVPMPEVTVQLFQEAATLAPDVAIRRFIENALGDGGSQELVDDLSARRVADPPDPVGWNAQVAAAVGFAGVGEIAAPTLILHGTDDNVVDHRNAGVLAALIAGSHVELFAGAGHLFFWEQPDAFVRIVTEFLTT